MSNRFDHNETKIDVLAENLVQHIVDESGIFEAAAEHALGVVKRGFPNLTMPIDEETNPHQAEWFYSEQNNYIQAALARVWVRLQAAVDEPAIEQAVAAE
jgi:hypothetical protein